MEKHRKTVKIRCILLTVEALCVRSTAAVHEEVSAFVPCLEACPCQFLHL